MDNDTSERCDCGAKIIRMGEGWCCPVCGWYQAKIPQRHLLVSAVFTDNQIANQAATAIHEMGGDEIQVREVWR